jgi:uncharacterized membrane protein (DUF4010 family)
MDIQDLLSRLAVALGIGLLIGLERGWRTRTAPAGSRTPGIPTFAITGLLGGVVGAVGQAAGGMGGVVIGIGLAAYAAVITAFCLEENRASENFSATTAIAAVVTFALGAYALLGDMRAAAAAAVATAALLALREDLHGWVKALTWPELRSVLVLLAMTFIALPIMPDDPVGPWGGVNPREVWLIAIVLAGVSFLGYAAVKYFGERHGLLLAAATGGLVSSTAVTLANARRAGTGEGRPRLLAAGVAVATGISFLRVMTIAAVLKPSLLPLLAPPLLAATAVAGGFAYFWVYGPRDGKEKQTAVKLRNPFGFWSVVALALSMGAIILLGRFLQSAFGSAGAIAGAATLGLFDVDAVTVAMARLAPDSLALAAATFAILAAVASNTVSKIVIGAALGRGWFAVDIALVGMAAAVAGAAALWVALSLAPAA